MVDATRTEGDKLPKISAVLQDADGPIDLSAASGVKMVLVPKGREGYAAETIDEAATVDDAPNGAVSWTPATAYPVGGVYSGKFIVDWGVNGTESFPEEWLEIVILPNLDITP